MGVSNPNDKPKIKLFQLRALVSVAEHGNFSEAALHLDLTQSAISHAIAALEEELGVILICRGRHGATFTPIGQQLLNYARQIDQLVAVMIKEANFAKGLDGGTLRLASLRSIATHLLPRAIANFSNHFPNIKISIVQYFHDADVLKSLREGSADIGFVELPLSDDYKTYAMAQDEYVVLLPPDAEIKSDCLTWKELERYPLILPSTNYSGYAALHQHLSNSGIPLKVAYEINEDSIIVGMVAQGLGAAILPRLAALPIPREVQTHELPVPFRRVLGSAILANALHPPSVFAFIEQGLALNDAHLEKTFSSQ
jgi:DNA-binding transcriptional LysR family regulator